MPAPFARKEPVINCPGCSTTVAADTSICPKCDYIIDASFLTGDAPAEPPSRPPARPARPAAKSGPRPALGGPRTGAPRPAGQRRPPGSGTRPAPGARAAAGGAKAAAPRPAPRPPPPQEEYEAEIPTGPGVDLRSSGPGRPEITNSGKIAAPEDAVRDLKDFVGGLNGGDKLAVIGGAITVLSGLLPWKRTVEDGDLLGLFTSGILTIILAGIAVAACVIRVRRAMPNLPTVVPWLVQLAAAGCALLWAIIFTRLASESIAGPLDSRVEVSIPSIGVYLAILGCAACGVGTLLGLKEKSI